MDDIASTKVTFFGPLPKFQVQRAGDALRYLAEFEHNNGVWAEFRAE